MVGKRTHPFETRFFLNFQVQVTLLKFYHKEEKNRGGKKGGFNGKFVSLARNLITSVNHLGAYLRGRNNTTDFAKLSHRSFYPHRPNLKLMDVTAEFCY